ncbi:Putative Holin-X, holin superfamily III [Pasteurella testudinis DSM 23072]|uniref:Putative Holin-X, holin superfamily III n=1 Tax=Pasteurella testudinis DSM 23072 TaxID=1122938 RepID=A0A1W1V8P9_9PAST|nr:phage holin family protein [Pasteurella testudinis]SMB89809.1 Putative Holin-X, holin superfamily III [Pasteurella testudinis DSM 23072]SUB52094.1 transmembrane protein [Pasteurella testudinis]
MQAINKIKSGIKSSFVTALELAHVRLEMAKLEFNQQKERALLVIAFALFGFLLLLLAGLSLIFALNAWLPEEDKFRVFMFIAAGCLAIVLILTVLIIRAIRQQRGFLNDTLREVKRDLAAIKQSLNPPK